MRTNLTSKQTQFYGLAFWEPSFGAPVYPADRVNVYGFRSGISMLTGLGYDSRRQDLDYTLRNFDLSGTTEATGQELMEQGLRVTIPDQPGAVIITYARAGT